MSKQPDDCPKPQGECPYESEGVSNRLSRIEALLEAQVEQRRLFADNINRVLDEQHLTVERHHDELAWLKEAVKNLLMLMEGQFGRPGLIVDEAENRQRIGMIEKWKQRQTAFIAGIVAAASVFGSAIGFVSALLFNWMKHK
jgi:hypothetical protein